MNLAPFSILVKMICGGMVESTTDYLARSRSSSDSAPI
jgi:hypothetical protein